MSIRWRKPKAYFFLRPNWEAAGLTVRRAWLTTITRTKTNFEQRVRRKYNVTRGLRYDVTNLTYPESAYLLRKLKREQDALFGIPYWTELVTLTAQAASGTKILLVTTTTGKEFEEDWLVALLDPSDPEDYEVGLVQVLATNQITLYDNLTKTWAAGTEVYPLLPMRMPRSTEMKHITDTYSGFEIEVIESREWKTSSTTTTMTTTSSSSTQSTTSSTTTTSSTSSSSTTTVTYWEPTEFVDYTRFAETDPNSELTVAMDSIIADLDDGLGGIRVVHRAKPDAFYIFEHYTSLTINSASDPNDPAPIMFWGLSNSLCDDYDDWYYTKEDGVFLYFWESTPFPGYGRFWIEDGDLPYYMYSYGSLVDLNDLPQTFYFKITRFADRWGTDQYMEVEIYSDEYRTLIETLDLVLSTPGKKYQYLYAALGAGYSGFFATNYTIGPLSLGEDVVFPTTSSSTSSSSTTSTTMTLSSTTTSTVPP